MKTVMYLGTFAVAGILLASPGWAQNTSPFSFNIGAGFTQPSGPDHRRLDTGFNINAGAGFNIVPHVGVQAEFGYNQLGIKSSLLNSIGVPDGQARIYSATLNPIIRFNPTGRFDFYLIGGGGYYHRTVEFTQPTIATVTAFDPFFGFFPVNVPANQVVSSQSQNKAGWNAGAGVSARIKGDSNLKFYAESRYHYIYTSPIRTTVWPVTFGLRW